MASLTIRDLRKSFGSTPVLRDVSLDIADGEFLTLVGPSGCGKTTLLRIVAGLDHADHGSVRIDGRPVDDLPPKQRDIAMVFQSYALYPYMTVRENMALPLTMRQMTRLQRLPLVGRLMPGAATARRAIDAAVETTAGPLGLQPLLARRPAQLSGGQRQRVALGRAMVRSPKVFLMDEPLSNLDAKLRVDTRAEISQLQREMGATFVYVTHDQVEAMTMSHRVALMMDGNLLQLDPPQRIYDDPADLRVAEFIGTPKINTLPGRRADGSWSVAQERWPVDVPSTDAADVRFAVRPEWFSLHDPAVTSVPGAGIVRGTLATIEPLGSETLLHLRVPGQSAVVTAKVEPARARDLAIGAPLALITRTVLAFDVQGLRLRGAEFAPGRRLEIVNG